MKGLASKSVLQVSLGGSILGISFLIQTVFSPDLALAGRINSTPNIQQNLDRFPDGNDERIYRKIVDRLKHQNSFKGNIVQQVALEFLGAEYQAGLLDRTLQETLIISLRQFDCLLFVETVLAIANNIQRRDGMAK